MPVNLSNTQITWGYYGLIWIMKGRTSKTRTHRNNPWLLIQHVVYTSRNGEEMNSWLSPLRLLSIVPAAWDDSVEWQSLFLVLHLSSPCPEPTLPWTSTTLKLQSSLWHQQIPHCVSENRIQPPTVTHCVWVNCLSCLQRDFFEPCPFNSTVAVM